MCQDLKTLLFSRYRITVGAVSVAAVEGRGSRVESERHKSNKVKQCKELFGETGIDFDNWSVVSFTTSTPPILHHVSKVKSKSKSKSKSGDGASAGEDVPS